MIKLSAADWCFVRPEDDPVDYYRKVKELGYLGIEMAAPERWSAVKETGLSLINIIGPGMQDGLNRIKNHARLIDEIGKLLEIAQMQKIDHVIIFSGNRAGQLDMEGLENTISALKQLARKAEATRVTLACEVLNSFDHEDYQADHSAYAFELVKAVSSPFVKVLYDIYHMGRMGENVRRDVLENLEFIHHLHVAGSPKRDFPGEGQEIDYPLLVRDIHRAGYRGYWGQEFIPGEDRFGELKRVADLFQSYASYV